MAEQEDQNAQNAAKILRRREVIYRLGPLRVERQLFRSSASEGPWREFHKRYVILEATPRAEFEVGGAPAQALEDHRRLLRFLHYCLDLMAPALEDPEERAIGYGPWRPRHAASDETGAGRPVMGMVKRHEAATLIAEALAALERAHPDLRPDPEDDYLFEDPQRERQRAADYASQEEWQRLHGGWPSPLRFEEEIGPLVAQHGPFRLHGLTVEGEPCWLDGAAGHWASLLVFDGGTAGTRLLKTPGAQGRNLHTEWQWVARYVTTWLRFLADSIAIGHETLSQASDPAIRAELERGLALRRTWYRRVSRALQQQQAALVHGRHA